jgi:lysophospholipase L1-like esterase
MRSTGSLRGFATLAVVVLLAACQGPSATQRPGATAAIVPTSPLGTTIPPSPSPVFADLRLVTIGDSIPLGGESCDGCRTFTDLWAEAIESSTGLEVDARNLSIPLLTGAELVARIDTDPGMRATVAASDIVIVTIGHNDTPWNAVDDDCDGESVVFDWASYAGACVTALATRHEQAVDHILGTVELLRGGEPTAVRVTTDYNDILGWPQAPPESTEPSVAVLDAFFAATCRATEAHGATCIDVYHAFNGAEGRGAAGDLLAEDYTHPSALGHQRIADLLIASGLSPLPLEG